MVNIDTKIGGYFKHGAFAVCGHTDANCPSQNKPKSPESIPNKPEAWLNQEREKNYNILVREIEEVYGSGKTGGQYLAELVKNYVQDYGTKVRFGNWFKPKQYSKIKFVLLNSTSLDEVTGTKIVRPMFVVDDEELYKNIESIFDMQAGETHGIHFNPGLFDEKTPWGKVGLIISRDNDTTMTHEARHSVDPYLVYGSEKRIGYDRAIAELFAFYKVYIQDRQQPDWSGYAERVAHYYEGYNVSVPDKEGRPKVEFMTMLRMAVDGIKKLREEFGDVATQRRLIQMKKLRELYPTA